MLAVFSHQVLRLLRDKALIVWTLGFPIVLSVIFMVQFSNLEESYKASPSREIGRASCRERV